MVIIKNFYVRVPNSKSRQWLKKQSNFYNNLFWTKKEEQKIKGDTYTLVLFILQMIIQNNEVELSTITR